MSKAQSRHREIFSSGSFFLDFNLIPRFPPFFPALQPFPCVPPHGPSVHGLFLHYMLLHAYVYAYVCICMCMHVDIFSTFLFSGAARLCAEWGPCPYTTFKGAHSQTRPSMALLFKGKEWLSGCPQSGSCYLFPVSASHREAEMGRGRERRE